MITQKMCDKKNRWSLACMEQETARDGVEKEVFCEVHHMYGLYRRNFEAVRSIYTNVRRTEGGMNGRMKESWKHSHFSQKLLYASDSDWLHSIVQCKRQLLYTQSL